MKSRRTRALLYGVGLFSILFGMLAAELSAGAHRSLEGSDSRAAEIPDGGEVRRVGAYLFYWYYFPNQPEFPDLEYAFAFHPPALSTEDTAYHTCDPESRYAIPYWGGTYNETYYNSGFLPGYSEHPQRWWEWQFRDMVEAGLDFAVLNSWDGVDFTRPATRIESVAPYLDAALDALGNPLQVALYDDTYSEVYQWNLDTYGQLPPPECRPPTRPGCESYRMPLDDPNNRRYFLDKLDAFYGSVERGHWATLDGTPVEAGGRPLILLHQGEGLLREFSSGGTRHAAQLLCTIKAYMIEHFSTGDPFLLPNGTWGLWGAGDPALIQPTRCSEVGVVVPGDPYVIDGWSAYGMAGGGQCAPSSYPGVCLFSYNTDATYTTAFIGPGSDLCTEGSPCAYSGSFGGAGPTERPLYNARWWSLEGEPPPPWGDYCANGACQDRYYFQSWSVVAAAQPAVDLVVVESWNELVEGTSISKLTTYVGPDLTGDPSHPIYFDDNPYHEPPWSPWYWVFRTRDIIADWRGDSSGAEVIVDDPAFASGWSRDEGALGQWFYGGWFHYVRDDGAAASLAWSPALPQEGLYDLYVRWPFGLGATQAAPYRVRHAAGTALVRMDQSRYWDAGGWAFLGRYPFRAGVAQGAVELTNQVQDPQGTYVLADAVRFSYREPLPARPSEPQAFLSRIDIGVGQSQAGSGPAPAWAEPYPPPDSAPQALPALPPTPAPFYGAASYPGPTVTPLPSPTPTPSPTPSPPDEMAPASSVDPLPAFHNQAGTWVTWTADDPGGSGVARIHIQVRDQADGFWQDWQLYAGTVSHFDQGEDGHTYDFRSRATDWSGNVEAWPADGDYDARTTVDLTPPASVVADLPPFSSPTFSVSWVGSDAVSGVEDYDVQVCANCINPSVGWSDWLTGTAETSAVFAGLHGHTYAFRCRARDRAGNLEPWPGQADSVTTVDAVPPTSRVDRLPAYSRPPFAVAWSGQDNPGGSGVVSYDLQACRVDCALPGARWTDWLTATSETGALFDGEEGPVSFRCRARDGAGNEEAYPTLPDTSTLIDATPPSSQVGDLPPYSGPSFVVSWEGQDGLSGVASYDLQIRSGAGRGRGDDGVWVDWLSGTAALSATFAEGTDGQIYAFRSRARDCAGNLEPWPEQADVSTTVDLSPPVSQVDPLPSYSRPAFAVAWNGHDAVSAVASFDLQICWQDCLDPGGRWHDWLTETVRLSATFDGEDGLTYALRSRARDLVGNTEAWPVDPDAWTTVDGVPPSSRVSSLPPYSPPSFVVTWVGQDDRSGVAAYDVQVCPTEDPDPDPDCWVDWLSTTAALSATFVDGEDGLMYAFRCRARDGAGNVEPYPQEPDALTLVDGRGPRTWMDPPFSIIGDAGVTQLRWHGEDDGSGVASYSLYVRDEAEESWVSWLAEVTATEATFTGTAGHTVHFCVRGLDRAGNLEEKDCPGPAGGWPIAGEVRWGVPPTSQVAALPDVAPGNPFPVRWSGTADVVAYDVQVMDQGEGVWRDWLRGTPDTTAWFAGEPEHRYAFRCRAVASVGDGPIEPWPWGEDAWTTVPWPAVDGVGKGRPEPAFLGMVPRPPAPAGWGPRQPWVC